jgi:hypothetical protein
VAIVKQGLMFSLGLCVSLLILACSSDNGGPSSRGGSGGSIGLSDSSARGGSGGAVSSGGSSGSGESRTGGSSGSGGDGAGGLGANGGSTGSGGSSAAGGETGSGGSNAARCSTGSGGTGGGGAGGSTVRGGGNAKRMDGGAVNRRRTYTKGASAPGDAGGTGDDTAGGDDTARARLDGGAMDGGPLDVEPINSMLVLLDAEEDTGKLDVVVGLPADGVTSAPLLTLDSLTVTPLALNPQFSAGIHDYYVSCGTGTNYLKVAATASSGATVRLRRPTTSAAAPSQNTSMELLEDQAIVLEVTALGATDQYWVRCLPHDFPPISVTNHPTLGGPTPGWYLIANLTQAAGESSFAMAVDAHGTPVWYHRVLTSTGTLNVEALEHDALSFAPRLGSNFGTDPNGRYEIHQLGTSQVRYVQAVGTPTDHHEFRLLPNGDALVVSFAITRGVDLGGNADYGSDTTIADCAIQEIDSAGNLVWSWLASDHFDPGRESVAPQAVAINGEDVVDTFHCNSIDVDANGNLLVSARHMDAVFLVNKQTGKVVWKMGGVAYNKDGARLIRIQGDPEMGFNRQHDARLRPNGNVSLFDDHSDGSGPARGVEYAIDSTSGTATVAWQYLGNASSASMGSCRRYADGNSVIGWGTLMVTNGPVLSEVDSFGNDVLDISFASGDLSYRAVKVTEDLVELSLLRETAGQ